MASLPLVAILLVVCSSFVSSGVLNGPFRGYQYSASSSQSQSYDSRTGAYTSYSVTSRQCSVIRRYTTYERVNIPFLCHVRSQRVVTLPPHIDATTTQILNAMKAGGWSLCYKSLPVPVYRFKRIPTCCPGTTPTWNGGCLAKKTVQPPARAPSPGQLLHSSRYGGTQDSRTNYPGYKYVPANPRATVVVKAPRPYRTIISRLPAKDAQQGGLIQQIITSLIRNGPAYTTKNRDTVTPPPAYQPRPAATHTGNRRPPAPTSPAMEWQNDIARYLAAMMYQKLMVEHQQQTLRDEIDRQNWLRKQMEFFISQQRKWALQQQQQQQQLLLQQQQQRQKDGNQATDKPQIPNTNPNPIPPPPPAQASTPSPLPQRPVTMREEESIPSDGGQQGRWQGGILDKMPHLRQPPTSTSRPQVFGNQGPASLPQRPPQTMEAQMAEMKEKVKKVIDDCMAQSGITSTMESIIQSGDPARLRPVCQASQTVGPCVMQAAQSLGADQVAMVGRQMLQSVFMSLGQMCVNLQKSDEQSGAMNNEMTTPPVFPNSAPAITTSAVTDGTVEPKDKDNKEPTAVTETSQPVDDVIEVGAEESATPAVDTEPVTEETPQDLAAPNAKQVQKEKHPNHDKVAEASFPMWMILAMVGASAALLLFCCLTVCLVLRCRRKRKTVELERQPEKLPMPAEANIYAASPCVPPPAYVTTAVKQTLGGEEEDDMEGQEFKIPEDEGHPAKELPKEAEEEKEEGKEKEEKQ